MSLPAKSIQVDYRSYHLVRDTPQKLEGWLADNGYCLRLMSSLDGMATMVAPEQCAPLRRDALPEDKKLREELLRDIGRVGFDEKPEGTFERGDIRLFVQSITARNQMREIRAKERAVQESTETVYEQVEEWNSQIATDSKGGVAPGYVTADPSQVPSGMPAPHVGAVGDHARGGQEELARNLSLGEKLQQANEDAKPQL